MLAQNEPAEHDGSARNRPWRDWLAKDETIPAVDGNHWEKVKEGAHGTRHLPGAAVGSFLYLLPVIAVAAGYLILGEPITPWLVGGGAIMLAGVALAQSGSREH